MAQRVKFGDVRSESIQGTGRPLESYMGYSSSENRPTPEGPTKNEWRSINSQTPKEYSNAQEDIQNDYSSYESYGDYEPMTGKEANELFFNGIDNRTKRPTFCDKLGKCFVLGAAAIASAKAMGLFGGKTQKTKRRKNKNKKTKRRR